MEMKAAPPVLAGQLLLVSLRTQVKFRILGETCFSSVSDLGQVGEPLFAAQLDRVGLQFDDAPPGVADFSGKIGGIITPELFDLGQQRPGLVDDGIERLAVLRSQISVGRHPIQIGSEALHGFIDLGELAISRI